MNKQEQSNHRMHMEEVSVGLGSTSKRVEIPQPVTSARTSSGGLARRTFMKRLGLSGTALLPASTVLAGRTVARAARLNGGLSRGDAAILRFLAAAELLESDLWQQYNELALGNESYQLALNVLDGDEATYVNLNTRDEFSHANFINKYLEAKGQKPVSFDQFKILPSSQATGSNKGAKRLTNLMQLTVDTSFYFRYRSAS